MGGVRDTQESAENSTSSTSRRKLLGYLAGLGTGVGVAGYRNEQQKPVNTEQYDTFRDEDIYHIDAPEDTYAIVYGNHTTPEDSVPTTVDGVFLEGNTDYVNEPQKWIERLQNHVQYKDFMDTLAEEDISVYLSDLDTSFPKFNGQLVIGEYLTGLNLPVAKMVAQQQKQFETAKSGIMSGSLTVASIWLMSPGVTSIGRLVSEDTGLGHNMTAELHKTSERLHPEINRRTLKQRNAVHAYKLQWFAQQDPDHEEFATVWGAAHDQLEDLLQYEDDRLYQYIRNHPEWTENLNTPETFYSLVEFEPDNKSSWTEAARYEVPELKDLME